jgi:AcrR family transcriptional regulator
VEEDPRSTKPSETVISAAPAPALDSKSVRNYARSGALSPEESAARELLGPVPKDWRTYADLKLPPILEGALAAFAANGYPGSTVRDIAARVGMTVPSIYYHYQNKQDLLVTLMFSSIIDVLERCRAAVDEAGSSRKSQLSSIVECIVLYMANRRNLAFLDNEIRSLDAAHLRRYTNYRDELQNLLRSIIDSGCEEGVFATPYPPETSRAILAMSRGVALWYRPEGPLRAEDIAERYGIIALDSVRFLAFR